MGDGTAGSRAAALKAKQKAEREAAVKPVVEVPVAVEPEAQPAEEPEAPVVQPVQPVPPIKKPVAPAPLPSPEEMARRVESLQVTGAEAEAQAEFKRAAARRKALAEQAAATAGPAPEVPAITAAAEMPAVEILGAITPKTELGKAVERSAALMALENVDVGAEVAAPEVQQGTAPSPLRPSAPVPEDLLGRAIADKIIEYENSSIGASQILDYYVQDLGAGERIIADFQARTKARNPDLDPDKVTRTSVLANNPSINELPEGDDKEQRISAAVQKERDERGRKLTNRAMRWAAAAKVKGLWSGPILLRTKTVTMPDGTTREEPTLDPAEDPFKPRIVVMGFTKSSTSGEYVPIIRQQTPGAYIVDMLDLPQYIHTGLKAHSLGHDPELARLESVKKSIGERQTWLDLSSTELQRRETAEEVSPLEAALETASAATITVLYPTLDIGVGLVRKPLRFLMDVPQALEARRGAAILDDMTRALRANDLEGFKAAQNALRRGGFTKLTDEFNRVAGEVYEAEHLATHMPSHVRTEGLATPSQVYKEGQAAFLRKGVLGEIYDDAVSAELRNGAALDSIATRLRALLDDVPNLTDAEKAVLANYLPQPTVLRALTDSADDARRMRGILTDFAPPGRTNTTLMPALRKFIRENGEEIQRVVGELKAPTRITPVMADTAEALAKALRRSGPRKAIYETVGGFSDAAQRVGTRRIAVALARAENEMTRAEAAAKRTRMLLARQESTIAEAEARLAAAEQELAAIPLDAAGRSSRPRVAAEIRRRINDIKQELEPLLARRGLTRFELQNDLGIAEDTAAYTRGIAERARKMGLVSVAPEETEAITHLARVTGVDAKAAKAALARGERVTFDKPYVLQVFDPDAKRVVAKTMDSVSLDDVRAVQQALDSRPMTGTRGIGAKRTGTFVPEQAHEGLYAGAEGNGIWAKVQGITTRLIFGGDDMQALRRLPRHMQDAIKAAGRIGDNVLADIGTLVYEGDRAKTLAYLSGRSGLRFKDGKNVLTDGRSAVADTVSLLRGELDEARIAVRTYERLLASGAPQEELAAIASPEVLESLKQIVTEGKGLDDAALITSDPLLLALMRKPDSVVYDLNYALWQGFGVGDQGTVRRVLGALISEGDAVDDAVRLERAMQAIDESRLIASKDKAKDRVSMLLGGYSGHARARDHLAQAGLLLTQQQRDLLLAISYGDPLTTALRAEERGFAMAGTALAEGELTEARRLLDRFGPMKAEELAALDRTSYVPTLVRERLAKNLSRVTAPSRTATTAEAAVRMALQTYKRTVTQGLFFARPRYYLQNYWGNFEQIGTRLGYRAATMSAVRDLPALFQMVPGMANILALTRRQEGVQRLAQRAGDALSSAMARAGNTVEVNRILDGAEGSLIIGNRVYSYRDLRDICARHGVFDTFDSRYIERALYREASESTIGKLFEKVRPSAVSDFAQGLSLRQRTGTFATLIAMGKHPEEAARLTTDVLFDYATSITQGDRNLFVQLILPFWGWQKNANRFVFNAMMDPRMIWRLNIARKLPDAVGYLATDASYRAQYTAAGIDYDSMDAQQREMYDAMMARLAEEYGAEIPLSVLRDAALAVGGPRVLLEHGVPYREAGTMGRPSLTQIHEDYFTGTRYFPKPSKEMRKSYFTTRPAAAFVPKMTPEMELYYADFSGTDYAHTAFYWPEPIQYAMWRHAAGLVVLAFNAMGGSGGNPEQLATALTSEFDPFRAPLLGDALTAAQGKEAYSGYVAPEFYRLIVDTSPWMADFFTEVSARPGKVTKYKVAPGLPSFLFKRLGLGQINDWFETPMEEREAGKQRLERALRFTTGIMQRDVSPEETAEVEGSPQ